MIDYLYGTDFEGTTYDGRDFSTIYALIDPKYPAIPRYIGHSDSGVEYRMAKHITESLEGGKMRIVNLKQRWIRGLFSMGRQPQIKVIYSSMNPKYDVNDMEAHLINQYYQWSCNGTSRGDERIEHELKSTKVQKMVEFLRVQVKKAGLLLPEELDGKDNLGKAYPGILPD